MSKIRYIDRNFSRRSLALIDQANTVIREYAAQGFTLTLRQLYYQFVARDLLPNRVSEYKRLGSVVNDGRLAGLIDWNAIEDRTRNLASLAHWSDPSEIVAGAAAQYRVDKWDTQPHRVEVWIEKEALAGVFERVCTQLDVPFLSCRGYTSQSEMHAAALRLKGIARGGQRPVILHFGDHDPSGIDMTRDIRDRLRLFGVPLELRRLALNMDQVEQHRPPPNPAKETDSRFAGYIARFGGESWELDALEPALLAKLVRDTVEGLLDGDAWAKRVKAEHQQRELLRQASDRWDAVRGFLEGGDDD